MKAKKKFRDYERWLEESRLSLEEGREICVCINSLCFKQAALEEVIRELSVFDTDKLHALYDKEKFYFDDPSSSGYVSEELMLVESAANILFVLNTVLSFDDPKKKIDNQTIYEGLKQYKLHLWRLTDGLIGTAPWYSFEGKDGLIRDFRRLQRKDRNAKKKNV